MTLFYYLNRHHFVLLISTFALLAVWFVVNLFSNVYRRNNKGLKRAVKTLANCVKKQDLARFVSSIPKQYQYQWKMFAENEKPAQSIFVFCVLRQKMRFFFPFVICLMLSLSYLVTSIVFNNYAYAFAVAVYWLAVVLFSLLIIAKNKQAKKRAVKVFNKFVRNVGTVFDGKTPFGVVDNGAVDLLVEKINLLKFEEDCHLKVAKLLKEAGLDNFRTVAQQRKINLALSNLLCQQLPSNASK